MKNFIIHIFLLTLLFGSNLSASENSINKMPAWSKIKLKLADEYTKNTNITLSTKDINHPYLVSNGKLYIKMLVQLNDKNAVQQLKDLGCIINVETGSIVGITAPAENINAILELNSVKAAEVSQLYSLNLDKSVPAVNAREVKVDTQIKPSGILGGEDVIVGVFDTGIDITHPDFINENGTRILKLWDISDETSGFAPEGYDYGREYTKSDIDNSPELVLQKDIQGHGTHVAGIAAGNGSADSQYRGIAYNSDLIIVMGNRAGRSDFRTEDIIAGCEYIFREAEKLGKPVVINLSLGTPLGPHDGTGIMAQSLSDLVGNGKIIVAAAGNEGGFSIHAGGEIQKDETVEFPIYPFNLCLLFKNFCPDIPGYFLTAADLWYTKGAFDEFELGIYAESPSWHVLIHKETFNINEPKQNYMIIDKDNNQLGYINFINNPEVPSNGDGNFSIQIHNNGNTSLPIEDYIWSIGFNVKENSTIDMWAGIPIPNLFPFLPALGSSHFSGNNYVTIGSPADGDSIISVASFNSKNSWVDKNQINRSVGEPIGTLSSFSSQGPRRDGKLVPHIAAPGQIIFAAKSKDSDASNDIILDGDMLIGFQGTSMAAPHVTGAIALMLQINPNLGFSDIINIFQNAALKDEHTGSQNNYLYGYGKLEVQAMLDYLVETTGVNYVVVKDVKVYPNPTSDYITFELEDFVESPVVKLYTTTGEQLNNTFDYQIITSENNISQIMLNVSGLTSGVYNAECIFGNNKVSKFRFVVTSK